MKKAKMIWELSEKEKKELDESLKKASEKAEKERLEKEKARNEAKEKKQMEIMKFKERIGNMKINKLDLSLNKNIPFCNYKEEYQDLKLILKYENVVYFKDLIDLIGEFKYGESSPNSEKIGTYVKKSVFVPEKNETIIASGLLKDFYEPEHYVDELIFHYYTRSEMADKYFKKTNNNNELKKYILNLSKNEREKVEASLVEQAYMFFTSILNANDSFCTYPIHGKHEWQIEHNYIFAMRNILAKTINENNLNFIQSLVLAICFAEFITNPNYSKLVSSDNNTFIICVDNRLSKTLVINQDLIEKIKLIFNDNYIFKMAPVEAYALKSKINTLFREDWFKKYPTINKQNILDLIFYTENETELVKYLELLKEKSPEIQEKTIKFIEPISSYVSIKEDYTADSLYNVINFMNTVKFYKGAYIKGSYEKLIKCYRKDLKNTYTTRVRDWYDKYIDEDRILPINDMERQRFHLKNAISTSTEILGEEFNIGIKSGIWMMHTYFVDTFETYFRKQYNLLDKVLNSNNCEKYLDELLSAKAAIIKYAYINSSITLKEYYGDQKKLEILETKENEKAYEKVMTVKSFLEDDINLILEQINNENLNIEENKPKVKVKVNG